MNRGFVPSRALPQLVSFAAFVRSVGAYGFALLALIALSACSSTKPPPVPAGSPGKLVDSYRIGVDDTLQVSVWRNPELSVNVPVRPDGMISVPLVGDVQAGGRTPMEVAGEVKRKLAVYVREPNVTVIVSGLKSHEFLNRIRVTGAVRTSKSMPYRQGMTVLDAVLESGGPNDFASSNSTKLIRKVDGNVEVYDVRLRSILESGDLETNYVLLPGDVITVPERLF